MRRVNQSTTEVVMLTDMNTNSVTLPLADTNRLAAILLAAALGVALLAGVGFAQSGVVHNAAHDSRHAAAFPCH